MGLNRNKDIIELTCDVLARKYVSHCVAFDEEFLSEIESRITGSQEKLFRKTIANIADQQGSQIWQSNPTLRLSILQYVQECPDVILENSSGEHKYRRITDPWTPSVDQ